MRLYYLCFSYFSFYDVKLQAFMKFIVKCDSWLHSNNCSSLLILSLLLFCQSSFQKSCLLLKSSSTEYLKISFIVWIIEIKTLSYFFSFIIKFKIIFSFLTSTIIFFNFTLKFISHGKHSPFSYKDVNVIITQEF